MTDKPAPQQPKKSSKQQPEKGLSANEIELTADTIVGELMEVIIAAPRAMQVGWGALTEQQQKEILLHAEINAKLKISKIVVFIARHSTEGPVIPVKVVDNIKVRKGEIHAQINFAVDNPYLEEYLAQVHETAMLVLVSPKRFYGTEEGKPEAEPDQRPLNGFE